MGFCWGTVIGSDGQPTGKISCYPSETCDDCVVITAPPTVDEGPIGFVTFSAATGFHDDVLINATAEINRILHNASQERENRNEAIHILLTARGPLLAWVSERIETRPTREEKAQLLGL